MGPQRNPPGVHRWKTVVAYFGCEATDGKFIYFVQVNLFSNVPFYLFCQTNGEDVVVFPGYSPDIGEIDSPERQFGGL